MNQPDQLRQTTTSGRKTPELANPLNSEQDLFDEMPGLTGIEFVYQHLPESLKTSRVTFLYVIMGVSLEYAMTIYNRALLLEKPLCSGVLLELESLIEHGLKPERQHTLRIHVPNFGAATEVNDMLSLMSLEVRSIFPISYDGQTSIQSELRPREDRHPWSLRRYGLHPTLNRPVGTQD